MARAAQKKQLFSPPKASLFHKRMYFRDLFPWRSNLALFFKVALQDRNVIRSNSPSWVTAHGTGRETTPSLPCWRAEWKRRWLCSWTAGVGSAAAATAAPPGAETDSGNTCTPGPGFWDQWGRWVCQPWFAKKADPRTVPPEMQIPKVWGRSWEPSLILQSRGF